MVTTILARTRPKPAVRAAVLPKFAAELDHPDVVAVALVQIVEKWPASASSSRRRQRGSRRDGPAHPSWRRSPGGVLPAILPHRTLDYERDHVGLVHLSSQPLLDMQRRGLYQVCYDLSKRLGQGSGIIVTGWGKALIVPAEEGIP